MAGGIPHGFILEHIVFTGFRLGGVLLFAASGGIIFAVDIFLGEIYENNYILKRTIAFPLLPQMPHFPPCLLCLLCPLEIECPECLCLVWRTL